MQKQLNFQVAEKRRMSIEVKMKDQKDYENF